MKKVKQVMSLLVMLALVLSASPFAWGDSDTKEVIYDFGSTGKTGAYAQQDIAGGHALGGATSTGGNASWMGVNYYICSSKAGGWLSWYSDTGFLTFTVKTLNEKSYDEVNVITDYVMEWSADNIDWHNLAYTAAGTVICGGGYETTTLKASVIDDSAKYIRLKMMDPAYNKGFHYAAYETTVAAPEIVARSGGAALASGSMTDKSVVLSIYGAAKEEVSAVKNGGDYTVPEDYVFTEDGTYTVTAENSKGTAELSFTILKPQLSDTPIVYDIRQSKESGASTEPNMVKDMDYIDSGANESYVGTKYSLHAKTTSAYATWYSAEGFYSFYIKTHVAKGDSNWKNDFIFKWSADGTTFIESTVVSKGYELVGTAPLWSYHLTSDDFPETARYIRVEFKDTSWNKSVLEVGYTMALPQITATSNGDPVNEDATVDADVILAFKYAELAGISITKDNLPYVGSITNPIVLTQNGEYVVTAMSSGGTKTLSFTLAKVPMETIVYYMGQTNKTHVVAESNMFKGTGMGFGTTSEALNETNQANMGEKYSYYPNASSTGMATWYSEDGFESFTVHTMNPKNAVDYKPDYTLQWCATIDGEYQSLTIQHLGTADSGNNHQSHTLHAGAVPAEARYIRLSIRAGESRWQWAVKKVEYTTLLKEPVLTATTKTATGGSMEVWNGATARDDVLLQYTHVTDADITITKDNVAYAMPEGNLFKADGKYVVTATNEKGMVSLAFTIARTASNVSETYLFNQNNHEAAESAYEKLRTNPAIPGASAEWVKDNNSKVIINTTANLSGVDYGNVLGSAKLTVGMDGKGWNTDGQFYFYNQGYAGFSMTYTMASSAIGVKNQQIRVFVSETYNGTFREVRPASQTKLSSHKNVDIYNSVYFFNKNDLIVRVELHPDADPANIWKGNYMAVYELTKLKLPVITAVSGGNALENNDVTRQDVALTATNADSVLVLKDGVEYAMPANNLFTEDGIYVVKASNAAGVSQRGFIIARTIPVAKITDKQGNLLGNGDIAVDDITVTAYNGTASITRDGQPFTLPANNVLDQNGVYVVTVTGTGGTATVTVTLARPRPTVSAVNVTGNSLASGDTSVSDVTVSIVLADTIKIEKDGIDMAMPAEGKFTADGVYTVTATNKAGNTVLIFTVKKNPPLPAMEHSGDTVVSLDYEAGTRYDTNVFEFNNMVMDPSLKGNIWVGVTGPVLRPDVVESYKDPADETKTLYKAESAVTYRCAAFESFGAYVIVNPDIKTGTDAFTLYASSDNENFTELEFDVEQDISYISTGYKKYRIIAKDIPEGSRYIKVQINSTHSAKWAYCILKTEFSYNKANVGNLDLKELQYELERAGEGDIIEKDVRNGDTTIPASIFEIFQYYNITLRLNILGDDLEPLYRYEINGNDITDPQDFNIKVSKATLPENVANDGKSIALTLAQEGEWGMTAAFSVLTAAADGTTYYLYGADGDTLSRMDEAKTQDGWVTFMLTGGGSLLLSQNGNLPDNGGGDTNGEEKPGSNTATGVVFPTAVIGLVIGSAGLVAATKKRKRDDQ